MVAYRRSSTPRGFTLVELMLVVSLIGIISTIAIPAFAGFKERAYEVERTVVVEGLKKALVEDFAANNKFPDGCCGGWTWISTSPNPPWPYTGSKKPWDRNVWGWNRINFAPEGDVRYHYMVGGQSDPTGTSTIIWIYAIQNFDDDAFEQWNYFQYEKRGDLWVETYRTSWGVD